MNRGMILGLCSLASAVAVAAPVELTGPGDSYVFENQLCSEVNTAEITIAGRAFDAARDRLSIYGNGSIVIADGWTEPLTIYSEPDCKGTARVLERDRYYRGELQGEASYLPEEELGDFDNRVRSFRLKKGFMCTLANNPDGTGYSRVFIADNEDLTVNAMPEGLDFVSFVRVCRHDWVGKRGIAGGDIWKLTRSSWFYDWGASAVSDTDCEYVPMRHNRWWDGWDKINSRVDGANMLGFNEPDHADQSDLGTEVAIDMWPEYMKSGLRVGSPAPDCINKAWLKEFLAKADSLNYRVDFVATHMYWNSQDPYRLADDIAKLCKNTYGGRPMWITEWNNGANWTNEWWPDAKGPKRDAEFNIVLDENGKQTEVSRPHTEANSAVQKEWLGKALDAFDKCDWLERHSFYNWVEDARAVEINGKLTPAGKVFTEFNSRPAFNRATEYVHTWKIAPPRIMAIKSNRTRVRIDFYDHNGETAEGYKVERRINGGEWKEIAFITPGNGYKMGQTTFFADKDVVGGFMEYRMKAVSYKGTESIWSRVIGKEVKGSGIEDVDMSELTVNARPGGFVIESEESGELTVYAMDGREVRKVHFTEGITTVEGLDKGVYIVGGNKLLVK